MSAEPALDCRRLTVAYHGRPVLDGLDLLVHPGECVALLGPSGSGKTTLLHTVAGFVHPSAGEVRIAGRAVADRSRSQPPEVRRVGLVFQHYALWPHLSALETVAYPLRRRGLRGPAASARALQLLERLEIAALAQRRPVELSGGQQQRVALARALAADAQLYLFDEPTAHLDTALRATVQEELAARRRELGAACLYATHDSGEALAVADRVALLRDGRVGQVAAPVEVYGSPVDLEAALLTGPASVVTVAVVAAHADALVLRLGDVEATVPTGPRPAPAHPRPRPAPAARALVRPDWAALGGPLPATVSHVAFRGPHTDYRLETPGGQVVVRRAGPPVAGPGQHLGWTLQRVHLLGGATGDRDGAGAAPRG